MEEKVNRERCYQHFKAFFIKILIELVTTVMPFLIEKCDH